MDAKKRPVSARLGFFLNVAVLTIRYGIINMAKAAVRAWVKGLPMGPSIGNSFIRPLMANIPPSQIHAVLPSSIETYRAWTIASGNEPDIDVLEDGETRLFWLGQRKGVKALLFLHGGGYVMPLSPGHLDWMAYVKGEASKGGVDLDVGQFGYLSVWLIDEELVPDKQYPRQMMQAIVALKHLVASGYLPRNIIFGGDSAGGHLALSLLSHLHHPRLDNSSSMYDIELMESVRGCFLISPLASLNLNTSSYRRKCSVDVLSKEVVGDWGELLVRNSPWHSEISHGYGWGMALDVSEEWWGGLDCLDEIIITGGEEEVFRDHIVQLMDVFKRRVRSKVTGYVAEKEAHDGPLMDFLAKRAPGPTTKFVTEWIVDLMKS
ncbi:alpha/beta-hydrolase [Penicillium angulare]|uniref:Alpha/beta-hydrolase n=1 Tax=Penicillium angulare TaxID=116970 RepID=A0A9W9KS04_9EURO|nr:alpha/beta-hydrolase [Penicillium angulare]